MLHCGHEFLKQFLNFHFKLDEIVPRYGSTIKSSFLGLVGITFFDLDNSLIDEKSHENILIHDISYKILIDPKPLRIRFDKIDGFITIYGETRYLTLFGSVKYDAIYNKIRYLISLRSGITFFLTILRKSKLILIRDSY